MGMMNINCLEDTYGQFMFERSISSNNAGIGVQEK
jgi:hypothetical protein